MVDESNPVISRFTNKIKELINNKADKTNATQSYPGLMSAEDKIKLDAIDTQYSIDVEKQSTADTGFFSTYVIKQNDVQKGVKINIPKDFLVKSATVSTCTTADSPVSGYDVGDKYIDFVINSKDSTNTDEHLYLAAKEIGAYPVDEVTLTVVNGKLTIKDNAITWAKLATAVQNTINGKESASNKVNSVSANSTIIQYPSAKCVYDTFCQKDDPRLSDARTPTTHTHNVMDLNNYMPKSSNGGGTAGYLKVLNIKTNQAYLDDPITFEIYQRQGIKPIYCSLKFSGSNNTDPTVSSFKTWGSNNEVYIYKASTNNWQVIVKKIDYYEVITVENINCNWGRWSAWATTPSSIFTHLDETITSLPSNTSSNPLIKAIYDISDVLTDTDTDRSLSANQGKVLKGLIDGKVGTGDVRLTDERNPKTNYINPSSSNIVDLDNYKTTGFYYSSSNDKAYYIKNCPWSMVGNAPYSKNRAFWLLVETWGNSTSYVKQTLTYYYPNSITYIRVCNGGTWQPWKEVTINGMEEIINSTQAEGSSAWTGTSSRIVTLTSGTRINYWLKTSSGTNNVTLNLTLANGDTTGAKNVNLSEMAKKIPAWRMIELLWDGYNWNIINPTLNTTPFTVTYTDGTTSTINFVTR